MTPIRLAIASKNKFAFRSLLRAGADLYTKDLDGYIASTYTSTPIPATILKNYLDDSISLENTPDFVKSVTFNYRIFKQVNHTSSSATGNETEFVDLIQQNPELRTLLKHPLSESFLHVKWCLIKKYYYLNFAFYLSFYVALNLYFYQIQDSPSSGINQKASILRRVSRLGLVLITSLLYIAFILRELDQFFISMKAYFGSLENWLKMMIILGVDAFFVFKPNADIAATVNLLMCLELVFLLGKHPWFSIYIEMFQKVVYNFAKFFALFSILAISFANSFYILFRDRTKGRTWSQNATNVDPSNQRIENSINLWPDLKVSLIKSIIMMTGELDASNLPLGENFNYSYVFLLLFILLVPMVLYNLLNGLAVSDTNAIMKDSEIFVIMSRVNLIRHLERLLNSKLLQCFFVFWPGRLNHRLFTDVDREKLTVRSNLGYIIQFEEFGKEIGKMPLTIIKQAEQIAEKQDRSISVQNMDQILRADAVKITSSESKSVDKAVHKIQVRSQRQGRQCGASYQKTACLAY
ncbi:transient receptor potential cation channel protein painless-like [Planococcus citri]|uniref:transient receptor potential cation channel protein painless-like n=1 Tax=Planococcus citri TaxID=170843 RepID=UPI0031F98B5D